MFYDKNNTLLHCEIKNIDTDSVKHRVEYNHDGSISKYELYYYGTTCFTYEYNNDGLLTKINDYFDDKLTGYSTFEYAKNNNCTKSYSFSPDGTLYSYSIYEYSNKGRKVYTYSPTGKLNFTKEYNSNGYPIKDTIYDKNGEIDTQIEYDEKGQIKKKIIYCGYGWKKIAEKNRVVRELRKKAGLEK